MSAVSLGVLSWDLERDDQGFRTFTVLQRVKTDSVESGPAEVMSASGLFAVGSSWSFPADSDPFVYCLPYLKVTQEHTEGEPSEYWKAEQRFSNAPQSQQQSFDNPLTRPPVTSGSFIKMTKPADIDRNGNPICSTSFEPYKFEVDESRPTVQISMIFDSLPLTTYAAMVDTVNDSILWGLPARCIKLSNISWSRHAYSGGLFYYEVTYEFEINFRSFDRTEINHGFKRLKEGGNVNKPEDYEIIKDKNGENTPVPMPLKANGQVAANVSEYVTQTFQYYPQSNFLLLGIPAIL